MKTIIENFPYILMGWVSGNLMSKREWLLSSMLVLAFIYLLLRPIMLKRYERKA
jgi:hypothetical protein